MELSPRTRVLMFLITASLTIAASLFYFKNKKLEYINLAGLNNRIFEDDLVFFKDMTPTSKELPENLIIEDMNDELFLNGININPGFVRSSGFYEQFYNGIDPSSIKRALVAFYTKKDTKNSNEKYRLAVLEYFSKEEMELELRKIKPKYGDIYFKKDNFIIVASAQSAGADFFQAVRNKNKTFEEIKDNFFTTESIFPAENKEIIENTNISKIKIRNGNSLYLAIQDNLAINTNEDVVNYLKKKSHGLYNNKILKKQKINNHNHYLIESSYCDWDFSKKCRPEDYFVISENLDIRPVFYDTVALSNGEKTLIDLFKSAKVPTQIISYFENKPINNIKKELDLTEKDGEIYLVKNFTEEIYHGSVLDGKIIFNTKKVDNETKITFLQKIKSCNIFSSPLSSYVCERYLKITGNEKLTKKEAELFCQSLNQREKDKCFHTVAIELDSPDLCDKLENTPKNSEEISPREICQDDVYIYNHYTCGEVKKITLNLKKEQKCNENKIIDCQALLACVNQNQDNPEICAENEVACHGECERLYAICGNGSYTKNLIYPEICEKTDCDQ